MGNLQLLLPHGRILKQCLRKIAAGRRLRHFALEQLATLLSEIEAVLNSQPLTCVYEDFGLGVVLTPFPFPCSHATENLVFEQDVDFQPNKDSITQLIKTVGRKQ